MRRGRAYDEVKYDGKMMGTCALLDFLEKGSLSMVQHSEVLQQALAQPFVLAQVQALPLGPVSGPWSWQAPLSQALTQPWLRPPASGPWHGPGPGRPWSWLGLGVLATRLARREAGASAGRLCNGATLLGY